MTICLCCYLMAHWILILCRLWGNKALALTKRLDLRPLHAAFLVCTQRLLGLERASHRQCFTICFLLAPL